MSQQWIQTIIHRSKKQRLARKTRRKLKRMLRLETLSSRTLLAADLAFEMPTEPQPAMIAMQAEGEASSGQLHSMSNMGHAAAMALISAEQATHAAVTTGNWSDPNTWEDQALPTAGARILIPSGVSITVDSVMSTEFKTVGIHGELKFATDVNTELRVDTIVSTHNGRLEIGTAQNPIANGVRARVVFADDGAIDRTWDPTQVSRGAVLFGATSIHGADSTHRALLAVHPTAGATTLELSVAPSGWNVGDEIIITGTQGSTSDEVRTINVIKGNSVTLDQALSLDHVPPRSDLNVYVANTTRNVEFTSENTEVAHRGHIMFAHNPNTHVNNAKFTELGRTNKKIALDDIAFLPTDAVGNRTSAWVDFTTEAGPANNIRGRYAVHFHRTGVDPSSTPATIDGSVVVGSPGWGFVNHSSHVNMTNNVAYGVHGASFYTEAGDEIGTIENNIAIRTVNPNFRLEDNGEISVDLRAEQQDFGVDGDGFWLSGHLVNFRNNVSAGASGHGIIYWTDGLVEADRGRTSVRVGNIANGHLIPGRETIPTWWAPMADIQNNEAFNATIGFRARYIHSSIYLGDPGSSFHEPPPREYIETLNPTVDGLTVWGSRDGALLNYNERLSLRNARIVGIGAEYVRQGGTTDLGVGIDMYNEVSRGPGVVENVTVEGFNMGILAPRHDEWRMSNIQLRNTTDMLITKGSIAERSLVMDDVTFGDLQGTAVEGNENLRQNVVMDGEGDEDQPYWFLLTNRVSMNGQGLYFNEQAANHVPLAGENQCHYRVQIPAEFVGKTNQELHDRYGTSFGGAIIPQDATTADFLTGGVVADLPSAEPTDPPLYDVRVEEAVLIDPGTLTDFTPGGGGQHCDGDPGDDGEPGDDPGDDPDDDSEDDPDDDPGDDGEPGDDDDTGDEDTGDDDSGDDDTGDDDGDGNEDEDDDEDGDEDGDQEDGTGDEFDEVESDEDGLDGDTNEDEVGDSDGANSNFRDDDELDGSNAIGHDQMDVNKDGVTSPMDVLILLNHLNDSQSSLVREIANTIQEHLDINGDGLATPLDVLLILNYLNQSDHLGEGEASATVSDQLVSSTHDLVQNEYEFVGVPTVEDELLEDLVSRRKGW